MKILHRISTFLVLLMAGLALTSCLKLEPDVDEGENPNDGGECINPETGEPDVLVTCFADPCSVNSCEGDPEATCEANYCGGCHAIYTDADGEPAVCEPIACTKDAKVCPDGIVVGRDPLNNCEFFPCPDPIACTHDAKQCPDGSWVSRAPEDNCEFEPCPDE